MGEGEVLGSRYEILRTVSDGRRASVLQALDRVHDRLVALKVYPVSGDERDALLAEARLLMSMTPHPGLPVVRGDLFTEAGDRYVVVMNWIDGTDLQQVLDEQGDPGLPLADVIDVLGQVAGALDHLHSHVPPIVHGDVKPANLVRTATGQVVLVDFDVAGAHAGTGRVGTVGFVAPEVAAGEKPGPAADVFGLAATGVTLLNGRPPGEATPSYLGIDAAERGHVARVLRAALASDPSRRPASAGRLVASLRSASRSELPSGVVALLAAEVADSGQLWRQDPDDMRAAMARLRDIRDDVVDRRNGRVVSSMNEGDRTIAVFREAAAAALAALDLHDRLAEETFPPGFDVRLQIGVAVGDALLADGVYIGAVVDEVLGLRSAAAPMTTIVSEPTAELLLGLVGRHVSIVPLGPLRGSATHAGASVFGLTRPGAEHAARLVAPPVDSRAASTAATAPASALPAPRRSVVAEGLQQPSTLLSVVVAGFAVIFLIVLSPELGATAPALAVLVVALAAAVGSVVWHSRFSDTARRSRQDAAARLRARQRMDARARLAAGFASLESAVGVEAQRLLDVLGEEFEAVSAMVVRDAEHLPTTLSAVVPDLVEQTYRRGISALSDALELFRFADGPQHRRVRTELDELEQRLSRGIYDDDVARSRDEERRASRSQLLDRYGDARQRARDLLFEAERCAAALSEARTELASLANPNATVDAHTVVHTLQSTIRHVREVQDELRRLSDEPGTNL